MKQNHKKIIFAFFGVSLAITVLLFLWGPAISSFVCNNENYYSFFGATHADSSTCDNGIEGIFVAILALSFTLFLVSLVLFFVNRETFITWATFAVFTLPFLVFIILYFILSAKWGYGGIGVGINDSEAISIISISLAILFFLVSLLIIIVKSWKLRGK